MRLISFPFSSPLQNTKARLKVTQKEFKDLQWEHEVLEQRFSKVRAMDMKREHLGMGSSRPVPPQPTLNSWDPGV